MDCIRLYLEYDSTDNFVYFYAGIAKVDTVDFEDDGAFSVHYS